MNDVCVPSKQFKEVMLTNLFNYIYNYFPFSLLLHFEKTISLHRSNTPPYDFQVVFTLYWIVKRSVAESVPDRASAHTGNFVVEAVSDLEQYCSAPLRCRKWNVPYRIGF